MKKCLDLNYIIINILETVSSTCFHSHKLFEETMDASAPGSEPPNVHSLHQGILSRVLTMFVRILGNPVHEQELRPELCNLIAPDAQDPPKESEGQMCPLCCDEMNAPDNTRITYACCNTSVCSQCYAQPTRMVPGNTHHGGASDDHEINACEAETQVFGLCPFCRTENARVKIPPGKIAALKTLLWERFPSVCGTLKTMSNFYKEERDELKERFFHIKEALYRLNEAYKKKEHKNLVLYHENEVLKQENEALKRRIATLEARQQPVRVGRGTFFQQQRQVAARSESRHSQPAQCQAGGFQEQNPRWKTQLCRFHTQGSFCCKHYRDSSRCPFAHGPGELRPPSRRR